MSHSNRGKLRELSASEAGMIHSVINEAAVAYRGRIPDDCYHEPYMPVQEVLREMENMVFFGWQGPGENTMVGVIGFQLVQDVTLVRHMYVLPEYQNRGIGTELLDHVKRMTKTRNLLVGTWRDATWAIRFYEKHGFRLVPDKDALLRRYWTIPERQIETSVVLGIELPGNADETREEDRCSVR